MLGRLGCAILVWTGCSATSPSHTTEHQDEPWLACQPGELGVVTTPIEIASTEGRMPATAGQMTESFAMAKRAYDGERWAEARTLLGRVVRGDTGDDTANKQIAEYLAAVCAFRLQDYRAALSGFALISSDPAHLKYTETLLWLARLVTQPNTSTAAIDLVVRYDDAQISRFDNSQQRDLLGLIRFAVGRAWYRRGDRARARDALTRVPPDVPASSLAQRCLELVR